MLDLSWQELFLIAVVALVVIGPKDLPQVMRSVAGFVRKAKGLRAFKKSVRDDEEPMVDADEPARPRALPADHTTVGDPAKDRDRATHS
ncbi:MAG: Sec-independent protein translocase subunit TatA/TatB [Rhodospirillales bacterium]